MRIDPIFGSTALSFRPILHISGVDPALAHRFARSLIATDRFLPTHVHAIRIAKKSAARSKDRGAKIHRLPQREGDPHRYEFSNADTFDFFDAPFMLDYSDCVLIEGDRPLPEIDLEVFVAKPLAPGERLLEFRKPSSAGRSKRNDEDSATEGLAADPLAEFELVRQLLGLPGSPSNSKGLPPIEEHLRMLLRAGLREEHHSRRGGKRWTIHDSCRGIENAGLVIVHCESPAERARAESFLAELERIRSDPAVFEDVSSSKTTRVAITAVAGDVGDPKDPGTKKAIARIARLVANARRDPPR